MTATFALAPTFMGVPHSADYAGSRAVVLGLPFDCGTHPQRVGARLGPAAIREQSQLLRRFEPHSNLDPLALLNVIDAGDAPVSPGEIEPSFEAIEAAVHAIAAVGAIPITLGGDGAIVLPELRALGRCHPDLVAVHIDAHTDAYPIPGYNTATAFSRAVDEGILDARRSFHVGPRGNTMVPRVYDYGRELGYTIVPMREVVARGIEDVFGEIRDRVGARPVYLCFDMDFFDPSIAPGVCTPAWGGATAEQGLSVIEACGALNIVGMDVNTISPPHDTAGMSAHLAATVILNALNMLVRRNSG